MDSCRLGGACQAVKSDNVCEVLDAILSRKPQAVVATTASTSGVSLLRLGTSPPGVLEDGGAGGGLVRARDIYEWFDYSSLLDFQGKKLDFRACSQYARSCRPFQTAEAQWP